MGSSERAAHRTLQRVSEPVLSLDDDLQITHANDQASELFDANGDLHGKNLWEVYPERIEDRARNRIEKASETGKQLSYEEDHPTAGRFEVRVYPGEEGLSVLYLESRETTEGTDQTELTRAGEFLEQIQEISNIGGWEVDMRTGEQRWSEEVYQIYGLDTDEPPTVEKSIDFYHPEDRETLRDAFERLESEGEPYDLEVRFITADDELRWVRSKGEPWYEDGEIVGVRGTFQDITERKERENRLRELRETVHQLLGVETTEEAARLISDSAEEILGLEMNGIHLHDEHAEALEPVAVSEKSQDVLGEVPTLDSGLAWETFQAGEQQVHSDLSETSDVYNHETPMQSEMYLPLGDHGVFIVAATETDAFDEVDVTLAETLATNLEAALDRIEQRQELRRKQTFLERTEQVANAGGWEYSLKTEEGRWTDQMYRIHGLDPGEVLPPEQGLEFYHPEDRETIAEAFERLVAEGEPYDLEVRFITAEDELLWVRTKGKPQHEENGEIIRVGGTLQDITERKRREQEVKRQRDDLKVLNQMVRHDIRNDIQAVMVYAETLAARLEDKDEEYAEKILTSVNSAVELIQTAGDLAEVMLQVESNQDWVSLRHTLEDQVTEARKTNSQALITVKGVIPDTEVLANEMLSSVFRNIMENAVRHNDKEVPEVVVSATEHEDSVLVRIADNGPGIADEQKSEIFGRGEKGLESTGSGIGLHLVETLVEGYGGEVWVEDREGQSPSGNRTKSGDRAEHGSAGNRPAADDNDPEGAVFVVELPTSE